MNSRIPFYRLPEVVAAIPELQTPRTTSLHPMEIIRCLRLKVWDAAAQRMVSLGDLPPSSSGMLPANPSFAKPTADL